MPIDSSATSASKTACPCVHVIQAPAALSIQQSTWGSREWAAQTSEAVAALQGVVSQLEKTQPFLQVLRSQITHTFGASSIQSSRASRGRQISWDTEALKVRLEEQEFMVGLCAIFGQQVREWGRMKVG